MELIIFLVFLVTLSPIILVSAVSGLGASYLMEGVGHGWATLVGAAIGVATLAASAVCFVLLGIGVNHLYPMWGGYGDIRADDWYMFEFMFEWYLEDIVLGGYFLVQLLGAIFTWMACQRRSRRVLARRGDYPIC